MQFLFDIEFYLQYYKYLIFVVVTLLFYISTYQEEIHFNDLLFGKWPFGLTVTVLVYVLFVVVWIIL